MAPPDPIPWLLKQIDLDEMHAQAALTDSSGNWGVYYTDIGDHASAYREVHDDQNDVVVPATDEAPTSSQADHIATWDPGRALLECRSKRGLIEVIDSTLNGVKRDAALRLLVLPFADRFGYRQWVPD